jgi:hypothetical protein
MSYNEIRESLQSLTKEEREKLARDLKALALLDDPEFMEGITQAVDEYEAGTFVSREELDRRLAARRTAAA